MLIPFGLGHVPCLACPIGSIPKHVLAGGGCGLQLVISMCSFGKGQAFPSTKHRFSQDSSEFSWGQLKAAPFPIGDDPDLTPQNVSAVPCEPCKKFSDAA